MRVVLACTFPRDETLGSSRVPMRLAEQLGRLDVDVSLVFAEDLPRGPGGRGDLVTAPYRMAAALVKRGRDMDVVDIAGFDAWLYARLARRIRPRQATVARSNGIWDLGLSRATAVRETAGDLRATAHALLSELYQKNVVCRYERASIVEADVAMFPSTSDAREIVSRGWKPEAAVAAVNPGVDEYFTSTVPLAERRGVCFVGTFFYRKGCDITARAMSKMLRARPGETFTIFGAGLPAAEVLAAFDEDVRSRVVVAAPLSAVELARQLATFAILVFPTRYEGFGMVTVEAMRAGLAVVTTPTGAGIDVVRPDENGLHVPIGSADATAAAVLRLLDDPALRVRLATRAMADVEDRTWVRTAREMKAVYETAIARATARA